MTYLVLARKWRPQTFGDIVGQEHVTHTLQNAIRAGRIAHAFMFTGVRGVGKTTAARVLAKALNCEVGPTPEPCNQCDFCSEITQGRSVDVIEIDGASNTGVDDVRGILENVRYQPAACRFKIYIIDEVHMLSTSAFNALLKTLEEPPEHVKFVFATTDPHKVPATVQSRCQRYDFRRIPLRLVVERLARIAQSEGVEVSERAVFAIAREADGSMRDAQSLLDQLIAYSGNQIRDEHVHSVLGATDRQSLLRLAEALLKRDRVRCLALLDEIYVSGHDLRRLLRELLAHLHDVTLIQLGAADALRERWADEDLAEIEKQAGLLSIEELDRLFRGLLPLEAELARVPFPKLLFEMTLVRLTTSEPLIPLAETLAELRKLEDKLSVGSTSADSSSPNSSWAVSSHGRTATDHGAVRSTQARPRLTAPVTSPDPPPLRPRPGERSWNEFLEFIGRRRPVLKAPLESCSPVDFDANRILVLTAPAGLHFDYLSEAENRAILEQMAREFLGRPVTVRVQQGSAERAKQRPPSQRELKQLAAQHPLVRAAMDILGAQIQEVRPRQK